MKKELVLIASRAIALYLIFWGLDNFSYVPIDALSLSHYAGVPGSSVSDFLYKYHLLILSHHIVLGAALFVGAIWVYRCGPSVERFLSPSEADH